MNILIGCHCKQQKLMVQRYPERGNILHKRIFQKYGLNSVRYVNIEGCAEGRDQFVEWTSIPSQSIDRIWLMNCPIYCPKIRFQRILEGKLKFTMEEKRLFGELFTEGWRILRPGGKIMIPGVLANRSDEYMHFAYMVANEPNPWKLSIQNVGDAEFHIDDPEHKLQETEYHIYYEKPATKKQKKTRKTRKTRKTITTS